MATTEAQVANLALAFVGHAAPITSLADNTAAARACNSIYAPARDALLERYNWKFARKHVVLALLSGVERTAWAYCYELPADCLAPRALWSGTRTPRVDERIPFDWEAGDTGASILVTDQADAELEYTAKETTVAKFTPGFVKALAWAMAVELALVLPVKPALALRLDDKAKMALAQAVAAMEGTARKDAAPDSEYITER